MKNETEQLSQTIQLTELVKRDSHPTLLLPPGLKFQLYSLLL